MSNTKSHYLIALDEYKKKNYRNVINEMELYLKENKNNGIDARGLMVLAKSYYAVGMKKQSVKLYNIIIKLDPNNVHARLELGKLYAKQGREEDAEKLFQEYMTLDPNNVHARLELGKLYAKQGREEEAEKLFQEYMTLDPNNVHARLELGKLYAKQGREEKAEKLFERCKDLDPNDVHARLELGKLYAKQGREEAEKLFERCIDLDSNNVHARLELGKLYAEQGKTQLSTQMYEYIIDKLDEETFDEQNRIKHISKHMRDNKSKKQHGVFIKDPFKMLEDIKQQMNEENKKIGYMADIYVIKSEKCGYAGGKEGDRHQLDYVTVITLPNSRDLITMFPSDNIFELEKEIKTDIKHDENDSGECR